MRLVTPYAPTSYSYPCIVVSTQYFDNNEDCETAVLFNEALNQNHALAFDADEVAKIEKITGRRKISEWRVIKRHKTAQAAIDYHLRITKNFHNGSSDKDWAKGWRPYLKLYDKYCPGYMKERSRI